MKVVKDAEGNIKDILWSDVKPEVFPLIREFFAYLNNSAARIEQFKAEQQVA